MGTNYKITVQFDGSNYHGWQYQSPILKTIQGEVNDALKIIAKKRIVVTGSSRTDAGVHAIGLVANFFLPIKITPKSLERALNSLLPEDIRIVDCQTADNSFNARFSSLNKTYVYKIYCGQILSPFNYRYLTHIPYPLNKHEMRKCIKHFIGEKDFSSFTSDEPNKNRTREITEFNMRAKGDELIFTICGRSFLRYMVRNIVGTIIDVGRGKKSATDIPIIFLARDRRKAGRTAPGKGLTLVKVEY